MQGNRKEVNLLISNARVSSVPFATDSTRLVRIFTSEHIFVLRFDSRMLSVVKGNDAGLKGFQTN